MPRLFTFALALGISGAALADPPTLLINQKATLDSPATVTVYVDVNCGDAPSSAVVQVAVRQGEFVGSGSTPFASTGSKQQLAVVVAGGPFVPGDAAASATLTCSALLEGLVVGQMINIVPP
jgi:hypothetical protein